MNQRPPHEPSRIFPDPQKLWDEPWAHPRALGCETCQDLSRCGGVHTDAGVFDCGDLCSCRDKSECDMVCRFNPGHFVRRMREVDGLSFGTVPRVPAVDRPMLPGVVPFVDHKYRRSRILAERVVAISLYKLVNLGTGALQVQTRDELSARFLVPANATVVVSGVGKDPQVERWWELDNRTVMLDGLRNLGVGLITVPNFSVLNDVPRTDNLHSMKRIALAWSEIVAAGIPGALHINARTEFDYYRWSEFIAERPEINTLAFEFGTGAGRAGRIDWHVKQLCRIARSVGRPLCLLVRGGGRKLDELRSHFVSVVLLDTSAFAKTMRRRRAHLDERGRLRWQRFPTGAGEALDELLDHNVKIVRSYFAMRVKVPRKLRGLNSSARHFAADRDREPLQPSFVHQGDVSRETGAIAPER